MSSLSPYDLCNRALVRVGANTITSFVANSAESQAASQEYEPRVRERLSGVMPGWPPPGGAAFEWRFSLKQALLGTPNSVAPPDTNWAYAYNIPPDLLAIRAVGVQGGSPSVFTRVGTQIFTNDGINVLIDYTFRQVEANFPPYFTAALVEDLAEFFALALNRDSALAKEHRDRAVTLWTAARFADSKAMTPQIVKASRVMKARLGRPFG